MLTTDQQTARAIYHRLWTEAREHFAAGTVRTDPHLDQREADTRRGLTLLLRPDGAALAQIGAVIDDLRAIAPAQYHYPPESLHITLLSVISAAAGADLSAVPLDAFCTAIAPVCATAEPFTLRLLGLSAAPDAVFVYGEADGDAINALRDDLRIALRAAGLAAQLEQRYRSTTAHFTILRFRSVPERLPDLLAYVEAHRQRDLGVMQVGAVEFTSNDWYMSRDVVQVLARYDLLGGD